MRTRETNTWLGIAGFGAIAGLRTALAPALLGDRLLASGPGMAPRVLKILAGVELLLDKMPFAGARTRGLPLAARAVSGGLIGFLLGRHSRSPAGAALLGASTAVGAAVGAYHLRKQATQRLGVPNVLAGMLEDGLALLAGRALLAVVE
jgi:uncharacterized membrane protein